MSYLVRDVIARAMRLNGSLGAGETPGASDMTDAMLCANTLKASWFGTLIGGRLTEQSTSGTAQQAENGGEYAIQGVAFTLTAPLNPRSGGRFGVVDAANAFGAFNCTIVPNGRLIQGGASNLVLNVNGVGGRWWYRGDAGNWVLEAPWSDPSNVIEFPDALVAYMPYMLAVAFAAEFNTELRQDVIAANAEGRRAMAQTYAPRGRNLVEPSFGAPGQATVQQAAG